MPAKSTTAVARTTKIPEGVKQPADHQPKLPTPEKPVVEATDEAITVTHYGVTVVIESAALNDYELLEDSAEEDASKLPSVLRRLIGEEQVKAVKETLRDPKTGRVPLEGPRSISSWLSDVFEAANPS